MGEIPKQSGADSDVVGVDGASGQKRGPRTSAIFDKTKLWRSFGFALTGVAQTWRSEQNFRIEVVAGTLALALGLFLGANLVPIVLCCLIVLSLEVLNSALEATLDLLSPEPHPLAKRAKDAAAGAVLLAAVGAALVGLLVLGPPLWRLFG